MPSSSTAGGFDGAVQLSCGMDSTGGGSASLSSLSLMNMSLTLDTDGVTSKSCRKLMSRTTTNWWLLVSDISKFEKSSRSGSCKSAAQLLHCCCYYYYYYYYYWPLLCLVIQSGCGILCPVDQTRRVKFFFVWCSVYCNMGCCITSCLNSLAVDLFSIAFSKFEDIGQSTAVIASTQVTCVRLSWAWSVGIFFAFIHAKAAFRIQFIFRID